LGVGETPGGPASAIVPLDLLVTERNNRAVLYFKNKN
jgi:hypothetical protein